MEGAAYRFEEWRDSAWRAHSLSPLATPGALSTASVPARTPIRADLVPEGGAALAWPVGGLRAIFDGFAARLEGA